MIVEMKNVHKAFGKNEVLRGVDFTLEAGEVHALMGENGAGKSTMMNILTGVHAKDVGTITIDGEERYFKNPKEAEKAGIAFIHQELNVWNEMTVVDNMFIGREIKNAFGLLNTKAMREKTQQQFDRLAVKIPLDKYVKDCSVGEKQMIEIAKALLTDAQVIIMDEPTAALTEREIRELFKVIHSLRASGVSIVYISHRMEEIFEICDRITVMRDGKTVDTKAIVTTNFDEVVRKMVGRELTDRYPQRDAQIGETVLEVQNFTRAGHFDNISFSVKAGEIVGFSGLMGAGRTEIMQAIFGLTKRDSGTLIVNDVVIASSSPTTSVANGIGFLTEDRKEEGLILDFPIVDNIVLPSLKSFSPKGIMDRKEEKAFAKIVSERLIIKTESIETKAKNLSGGNQQKVVLAKWLSINPKVLILDEPTRGVDVGAKREIYNLMNELTARGVAIIMVSSELPEILGMSDRIMVVHEGKISGELTRAEATQEKIMTYATGGQ